jgi:alkylhydroperoxidase/carboxymuconolactone decarboxylase family protein YurZ
MTSEPQRLLRRIAAGDERCLESVMAPTPEFGLADCVSGEPLDRRTRTLVRLAALLVLGAPTTSVQWAAELASTNGADVDTITGVLLAAARAAGAARVVQSAPRLALALGFDLELDGRDRS